MKIEIIIGSLALAIALTVSGSVVAARYIEAVHPPDPCGACLSGLPDCADVKWSDKNLCVKHRETHMSGCLKLCLTK